MKDQNQLLDEITKFVEDNKALLNDGNRVDLTGLDVQVKNLCASVLQLSPEEREKYADSFNELLHELTILGEDMAIKKEALANEIRYLSSHKKASVAYQVADAKAKPVNSEDDN